MKDSQIDFFNSYTNCNSLKWYLFQPLWWKKVTKIKLFCYYQILDGLKKFLYNMNAIILIISAENKILSLCTLEVRESIGFSLELFELEYYEFLRRVN